MPSDQFLVLRAEFHTALDRLKQTTDLAEKEVLLREMRQVIKRFDRLLEARHSAIARRNSR